MVGRGAVGPLEAPAGDRVCLVAAMVSWVVGVEVPAGRADIAEPCAGVAAEAGLDAILEVEVEPEVILEDVEAGRGDAAIEPLVDGDIPPCGAIAPFSAVPPDAVVPLGDAVMEDVDGVMALSDAATGTGAMDVSVAGSSAGLLQAATDRAATPAAISRAVFIRLSPLRPEVDRHGCRTIAVDRCSRKCDLRIRRPSGRRTGLLPFRRTKAGRWRGCRRDRSRPRSGLRCRAGEPPGPTG